MVGDIYIGFHTSPNAGVVAMDQKGKVHFAAAEERYTKKKLQAGNPSLSFVLRTTLLTLF